MILGWLGFCLLFALVLAALLIAPIARHPTLPRRPKWLLSLAIFLVLVPGGLWLYGWVGMPPMVLF